jgi:hypothetical protein
MVRVAEKQAPRDARWDESDLRGLFFRSEEKLGRETVKKHSHRKIFSATASEKNAKAKKNFKEEGDFA